VVWEGAGRGVLRQPRGRGNMSELTRQQEERGRACRPRVGEEGIHILRHRGAGGLLTLAFPLTCAGSWSGDILSCLLGSRPGR
jgi:hypothetical protein